MRALFGKRMIPGISGILTVVGRMVGTGKALLTLRRMAPRLLSLLRLRAVIPGLGGCATTHRAPLATHLEWLGSSSQGGGRLRRLHARAAAAAVGLEVED